MSRTEGSTRVITGTLGGGKSMAAVDEALEHLSKGGTVITNIPIYRDKVAEWMRDEFGLIMDQKRLVLLDQASIGDFQNLAQRGNEKNTVMMVLDEAALDIGARDWKAHSDEQFNFVILCRKLIIDLVLIAQDANDVDKRIRQKMQTEVHCRSLMNLPVLAGLVRLPIFIRVNYTVEVGKKPWRTGAKFFWKAQSWGFYDSHALHGAKASMYAALEVADSSDLARVKYERWPYVLAVGTAFVTSVLSTLWLHAN